MSTWETVIVILGLAGLTVVTRGFFLIPDEEIKLPGWAKRGLKYAPIAALAAVIVPEILMSNGSLITTLLDARWSAAILASIYFFWRRGILGTILVGMAVYLPLHIGMGW